MRWTASDIEYSYRRMMDDVQRLCKKHPFIHVETIGQSVLGRPIQAIRLGEGPRKVHYNGAVHANEWITTMLLMKFADDIAGAYSDNVCVSDVDIRGAFGRTSLWIVPMANPDGVELAQKGTMPDHPFHSRLLEWNGGSPDFSGWKANVRGIDLNDQFPAYWEEEHARRSPAAPGPGPRDYTGEAPLTEPEAQALASLTRRHSFDLVMSFHTQGEEIYWNYRDYEPEYSEAMADRLARLSGYRAVKLDGSDAGYKDWFIQEFRRPGFTIECGFGVNPLPVSQFPAIYSQVFDMMLYGISEV